jgi:hypothetical protein
MGPWLARLADAAQLLVGVSGVVERRDALQEGGAILGDQGD